jgi:hypothetical protein
VVLTRDVPEYDLRAGDIGTVVHVHPERGIIVEFVRASGETQALAELTSADVRPVGDEDLLSVRRVRPGQGVQ